MQQSRDPFDRTELDGLVLENRFVRSATWLAGCDLDGYVTDRVVRRYEELAEGGVGAIITGITSVSPREAPLAGMAMLSDDSFIEGHRRLVDAVHRHGVPIISQLAVSSYVRVSDGMLEELDADDMTQDEIHEAVGWFVDAARRARDAGYDGVQIHVAHYFFLSRFVSPAVNHRTDMYGGSPDGRAMILRGIVSGIRRELGPSFPVIAKVNGTDEVPRGVDRDDVIAICRALKESGADAIEMSGNGTSRAGVRPGRGEGYFLPYAEDVRIAVGIPVVCVGGFRSLEACRDALRYVDYISISRPLVREPGLIAEWKNGRTEPSRCVSCNACYTTPGHVCRFA